MSKLFISIFHLLRKYPALYGLVVVLLVGYCVTGINRLQWDNDIFSLFPVKKVDRNYANQIQNLRTNNHITILLHNTDSTEEGIQNLLDAGQWWDSTLVNNPYLSTYLTYKSAALSERLQRQIYDQLLSQLPLILAPEVLDSVVHNLDKSDIDRILSGNKKWSQNMFGGVTAYYRNVDPLHLVPKILDQLKTFQTLPNIKQVNGFPVSNNEQNLLLDATAIFTDNNDPRYAPLRDTLMHIKSIASQHFQSIEPYYFGATFSAEINRDRSMKDGIWTGVIACLLTLILLTYFHRKFSLSLVALVPSVVGVGAALATFGFLDIPIVTMAMSAGTIILAMGINYAVHLIQSRLGAASVEEALKSVTKPLIIGNLTTIAAFGMLLLTDSLLLKHFGLLAVLSLFFGVLTTLILLPFWLIRTSATTKNAGSLWYEKLSHYPFHKNKWLIGFIIIGTIAMYFPSSKVKFQGDLSVLNYLPPTEKKGYDILENDLGINLSRTTLQINAQTLDSALAQYNNSRRELLQADTTAIIPNLTAFIPSSSTQYINSAHWHATWKDSLVNELIATTLSLEGGRERDRLIQFFKKTQSLDTLATPERLESILKDDLIARFITSDPAKGVTIKVPVLGNWDLEEYHHRKDFDLYNRQEIVNHTTQLLQSEFNSILLKSALIVFFLLLLVYGRIELTLLAFLPMAVSWIWILGIAYLLGIEIHLVNLILCTFIFGLCDDYSIFMTDGLIHKYRTGQDHIAKDKKAIIISVLVTMAGLIALLFGKHPAFISFGVLALVGLSVVLILSLTLQPAIFDFYVTKRTEKGNAPFTIITQIVTIITFGVFILIGLLLSLLGLILSITWLLRISFIKYGYHWLISKLALFNIWTVPYIRAKKELLGFVDFDQPGIIVANHQTHLDLLILLGLYPKMVVLTNNWVYHNPVYGGLVRSAGYLPGFEGMEHLIEKGKKAIEQGYSILIFPEGTRSPDGEIKRFKKGAFLLAEQLNVPIYPIVLHGLHPIITKGDQHIKPGYFTLHGMPPIRPDDPNYSSDYSERGKEINKQMREAYGKIIERVETPAYYFDFLKRSYLYKGPVTFWYAKIKTINEKLYAPIHALIPRDAKITDLGCGYGMASIMLKLCAKERQVIGVDYDEDKVQVAQNNLIAKTEKIRFECADIREYAVEDSDVFLMYDCLHYLNRQEQIDLLQRCIDHLNTNGMLLIRDGIEQSGRKRHFFTAITEFFSTKLLRFNKVTDTLQFVKLSDLEDLSTQNNLTLEMTSDSKITSNNLIIMRKNGVNTVFA